MRIYVVISYEDIYGTFSTLEKAKNHVDKLVNDDWETCYSIYSFVLDKSTLEYSEDMMKCEFEVDFGEVFDKGDD